MKIVKNLFNISQVDNYCEILEKKATTEHYNVTGYDSLWQNSHHWCQLFLYV